MPTWATSAKTRSAPPGWVWSSRAWRSTTWARAPWSCITPTRGTIRSSQMVPHFAYWPVLILATLAAVIASQAVITGAFSMTQQAVQLGLLPRIDIKRTSETQAGQIFVPAVNGLMMIGVLLLLVVFQSSHRLASAYGVAVTGTMFVSTLLAYVVVRQLWKWGWPRVIALLAPITVIDTVFLSSNLPKIPDGAWLPLAFGAGHGDRHVDLGPGRAPSSTSKSQARSVPLTDLIAMLAHPAAVARARHGDLSSPPTRTSRRWP